MVITFLTACFIGIDIIMFLFAVKAYRTDSPFRREVAGILGMGAAAILFYCLTIIIQDYFWISMAFSLNFICFDGIVCFLYLFSRKYTNASPLSGGKRRLLWLLLGCDAVLNLLNPFLGFLVTYGIKNVNDSVYSILDMKWLYWVHLAFCYVCFFLCVLNLVMKSIKSADIYRVKYVLLCAVLLVAALLNGLFVFTRLSVDFSVLTYAAAGIFIYNLTFTYVPERLRIKIVDFIMRASHDGILFFDADEICIYVNPRASGLFEQEGRIRDRSSFCKRWNLKPGQEGEEAEKKDLLIPCGEETLSVVVYSKVLKDAEEKLLGSFFWFKDITTQKKLTKEKEFLSRHDMLTGIYNRDYFFRQAEQMLSAGETGPMVMIAVNVERFKLINDVFGFEIGNQLLREIAGSFQNIILDQYRYGRIDSDRFAICITKNFPMEELLQICRIQSLEIADITFPIVINYGIYEIDDRAIPAEVMYDRAMLALDKVKGIYHTNVGYYDENLRNRLLEEQVILNDMEKAILEEQFVVYLQPQMNHANNRIVGAEALVRWEHPARGMISPADFIPLFEENGFITKLDQYVWDNVCRMIKRMRQEGRTNCSISVNISRKDFYYADLYQVFTDLIHRYDIPPESLKLEITESAFVMDVHKQMALVKKLQEAGFIIEMDDFGSGYSSLNTLKDIPVDILKMDMKFLSQSHDVERSKNILEMVVSLSRSLGMKVIAEGVETKKQADYLSGIGCENIQGYYYAKPMSAKEYEEYLSRYEYRDIMIRQD